MKVKIVIVLLLVVVWLGVGGWVFCYVVGGIYYIVYKIDLCQVQVEIWQEYWD